MKRLKIYINLKKKDFFMWAERCHYHHATRTSILRVEHMVPCKHDGMETVTKLVNIKCRR